MTGAGRLVVQAPGGPPNALNTPIAAWQGRAALAG